MNTPNKLTVFRIILVPFFVWALLKKNISFNFLLAEIIFGLACLTDKLDGKLARKTGQVTVFGKFLDPLADKILVLSAFLCFIEMGLISAVPVIIILFREFIVISVRLLAAKRGQVIAANFWGKLKTVSQMMAVIIFIGLLCLERGSLCSFGSVLFWGNFFVWLCTAVTLFSGALYILANREHLKGMLGLEDNT
jgi:CDP-diacylglycerol--glycerol-3-phosphate 3-phosphatidyltransferase